jgi:hypothetical protein
LRWLGEEADGQRDKDLALVWRDDKLALASAGEADFKNGFLDVRTDLEGDHGMRGGGVIEITYNGEALPVGNADAAFFTQSAVEKFVLPYYTRMKTPAEIQAIKNKLFANGIVVALHDPPSITRGIGQPRGPDDPKEFKALEFDEVAKKFRVREARPPEPLP